MGEERVGEKRIALRYGRLQVARKDNPINLRMCLLRVIGAAVRAKETVNKGTMH
jgi:hypothetical protein